MAKKDFYHETVKEALIKDGWEITHDPYYLETPGITYEVDLAGEKVIAAQKGKTKIAVEIKSFLASSKTYEFHEALGQFLLYHVNMQVNDPNRTLFLAIPQDIYDHLFRFEAILRAATEYDLKIIVFDPDKIEITLWKKMKNSR